MYAPFLFEAMNRKNSTLIFFITFAFVFLLPACSSEREVISHESSKVDIVETTTVQTTSAPSTPLLSEGTTVTTTSIDLYTGTEDMPWWNDTVFYEVFVRSFYDSDGDGIGDLQGLIQQLDYLNDGDPETNNDLGITGIWLMPIMKSPSYHGYDVVDYYQVDQDYGSREDLVQLVEEAHSRGIRIVVDLMLNHTSSEHPWFIDAADPDSEFRDWYIWSDERLSYRGPWGEQVWHPSDDGYYYGVFWEGMPDLNLENPEVTQELYEVTRYWMEDIGVDGFRLDAIKHLIEDGRLQENTPATHKWLADYHNFYKSLNPNALAVGEAWTGTQQVVDYTGDEVDIAFQFDLAEDILGATREGIGSLLKNTQSEVVESFPAGQYAVFLTNHDQNRVMSQMAGDEGAAKVAASILLTSPGVPFIYYGEEIGMTGTKPDEDIRRPMLWDNSSPAAGFSEGDPWRAPSSDFTERNVADQLSDPDSLLNHYRSLIHLRDQSAALRVGDWMLIETTPGRLYASLRYVGDEILLILVNPSRKVVDDYSLAITESPLRGIVDASLLFGDGLVSAPEIDEKGGFTAYKPLDQLPPQSTFILHLSP